MLTEHVTDWRKFSATTAAGQRLRESVSLAVGLQPSPPSYRVNALRNNFYGILEHIERYRERNCEGSGLHSFITQAFGEAAGSFAASYYNWCEAQGVVSEGMQRLDQTLSKGV